MLHEIIADLCSHLNAEEQTQAAENFDQFATTLCEIIIRVAGEPGAQNKLAEMRWEELLEAQGPARMIPVTER